MADWGQYYTIEQIQQEARKLTTNDFIDFFNETIKNHHCLLCNTNDWEFAGGQGTMMALVGLEMDATLRLPPPSMALAVVACKTCGNVRSHALGVIAKWSLARKGLNP